MLTLRAKAYPLLFMLAALCLPLRLAAQTAISSTILGTVTDPSKAAIPSAEVILKNVDTGQEWKTVTGEGGEHVFPNLKAGNYRVEVTKAGFKKVVSDVISLENGITQRIDLTMQVGAITEQVTVVGAAPALQTDEANVNQIVENRMVRDLPIEGRNFLDYATLAPLFNSGSGDQLRRDWGLASITMPGGKVLNLGGTEYSVGYYVDGVNLNDSWVEGPTTNVPIDSVQEVKTEIVNYSAEYGREVGQLSMTTKSGTNHLHGSVYDFRMVNGLNARDPYTIFEDPDRGRDHWHHDQFGFAVGGPVVIPRVYNGRNKAFFFASYDGYRRKGFETQLAYTPTERERNGDFGEWLERFPGDPSMVIYDPSSFDSVTQERQAFPNNVITNPHAKALEYLSHFPVPNFTSPIAEDIRNWKGIAETDTRYNTFAARFDFVASAKDQFFIKYNRHQGSRLVAGGLIPELGTGGPGPNNRSNSIGANWVRTFAPTLTSELTFHYFLGHNRPDDPKTIQRLAGVDWFRNLVQNVSLPAGGLSDFDKQQLELEDDGIYALNIGDPFNSMSLGRDEWWYQYIPQLQIDEKATKVFGRHTFKAGFRYFRREERDNDVIRSIFVGGGYTGRGPFVPDGSGWNTLAEFATGVVTAMTQRNLITGGDASLYFRMPEWGWFVGDKWQATRKLTLDLGVRYELAPQAFSVNDYWGVLDKNFAGFRMFMPGLTPGSKNPPYPADKNNFAPRIGFAYRVRDDWVVRAGYGVFYDTGRYKFMDQMFFNSPGYGGVFFDSPTYAALNGLDPNQVWFTLDNSFPPSPELGRGDWPEAVGDKGGVLCPRCDTYTIDEVTPIAPYLQRWSLDVQRQLGHNMVVSVGYVGSKGTKLTIDDDLNLPPEGVYLNSDDFHLARPNSQDPQFVDRFGSILAIHRGGNNGYHAMLAKFERKFSGGLSLMTHYTWSKMTDTFFNTSGYTNVSAIGGQWHRDWSHGLSDADHRHRFVASLVYELPLGRNWRGIAKTLAGGWQVNSITVFESGAPATVFNGDTSSFDYMGDVPSRTCNGNLSGGQGSFFRYFDTSCFVNAPDLNEDGIADFRGTAGRNIIRGPGINNWDLSIFKKFAIGEGRSLDFRWEMFNAFNHAQWSSVNTWNDTGTNPLSTFGRISGGRAGRRIQFALKFVF